MVDSNNECMPWNLGRTCSACKEDILGEETGRQFDEVINLWQDSDDSGNDTETDEPIFGRLPSKDHRQPNSDVMYTCPTCDYDLCWVCAAEDSKKHMNARVWRTKALHKTSVKCLGKASCELLPYHQAN